MWAERAFIPGQSETNTATFTRNTKVWLSFKSQVRFLVFFPKAVSKKKKKVKKKSFLLFISLKFSSRHFQLNCSE